MEQGRGEVACLQLAALQRGVVHRSQVVACGFGLRRVRRRLAAGRWEELCPAVYRVGGAPLSWRQALTAALLWAGEGVVRPAAGVISHRGAAALWGFGRFEEGPVELTVTRDLRPREPVVVHRVDHLHHADLARVDGLPVTGVARTLLDLSGAVPFEDLRAAVDEAVRRRWTTAAQLDSLLRRRTGHRGVRQLRALVTRLLGGEAPTESELEARVLDLLDAEGLPRPQKQHRLRRRGQRYRLDFLYEGPRVVIEADGYASHADADAFERDRARDNALALAGYLVLHWTWAAVRERPSELASELRHALAARGG